MPLGHPRNLAEILQHQLIEYCSRYVFAPICRGVTSKRSVIDPLEGNKQAIFDLLFRNIKENEEENRQKFAWSKLKYNLKDEEVKVCPRFFYDLKFVYDFFQG